ncbi:butyrophilin subfamily 3 member A2-like [Carettochelys insculpta]|uniref:butyrophilin subfamily 3 member A2-like n=1 Tax=Carettochelys insculpta TaxID=44489 RepID=UPI003EB6CAEE
MDGFLDSLVSVKSLLPRYIIFLLGLHLHQLESVNFKVIGPSHPITAFVGENALLPCHLSPSVSAVEMEIRWLRLPVAEIVHLYCDGRDQPEKQSGGYRGRTELLRDGISQGSVSLRILNIKPADEGQYSCFFQSSTFHEDATLELKVAGLGSALHLSIDGYQDGGIRISCNVFGLYPEPEVQWRDNHGQLIAPSSVRTSQEANGLFEAQASIIITEMCSRNLSCSVWNPLLNQGRKSTIYTADPFFPKVSPWVVAFCVILTAWSSLTLLAGFYFWKHSRKSKGVTSQSHLERALEQVRSKVEKLWLGYTWVWDEAWCSGAGPTTCPYYRELRSILGLRWRRVRQYAVNVTLDPSTASPRLYVPEDGKSVKWNISQLEVPDNPERFDCETCVLGCEGITSGRHYWEAEMWKGRVWALRVANKSVRRKGLIRYSPEEGIWAVDQCGGQYRSCTNPEILLSLKVIAKKIGVYVDYEGGWVSFYDGVNGAPIYIFTTCFTETIFPFFWVYSEIRLPVTHSGESGEHVPLRPMPQARTAPR